MAFENGNGNSMYMPVAPAGYGGGFGNFGGDGWWIILLLLCGWGGFGGMNGMGMWPMMNASMGGYELYPWLNNSQNNNDGFRDVLLGISGVNQNICTTGNAVTGAVRDGFYSAEIGANNRQTANMQQMFGLQGIMQQGFAANAAETADVKYTIAQEACATRSASSQDTQKILDKLCQLELDNVKAQYAAEQRENNQLRTELMYARGQASQIEQTYTLTNGQYNRLKNCPVPSQPVYGTQPIFTCGGNGSGCGCGGVA